VVSMLASGTRVRGFQSGRSRRIFSGEKILSMPSFGRDVKPFEDLRHVKEPYNLPWKSQVIGKISQPFLARCLKAGESNGNLPLRICLVRSVPEPYRSP
jgi:hypothetical protein